MLTVDLNCDMGEGYSFDEQIMPWISSVNIACGAHAGDKTLMRKTIRSAMKNKVAIGAHPSFPDRDNFGRIAMRLSALEIYDTIYAQISLIRKFCEESGIGLHHVKPHGALYNVAAKDDRTASAICKAVKDVDKRLILFGLSGSRLIAIASEMGLRVCNEVFADRTYQDDGSLTPRSFQNALVNSVDGAVENVIGMVINRNIKSVSGQLIDVVADTICIHGDGMHAAPFAERIANALKANNILVTAPQ